MMIELKNIEKRFGDLMVLNDVSLSVAEGAVMALVGPSGGGKSTLLRCINLLEFRRQVQWRSRGTGWNSTPAADKLEANPAASPTYRHGLSELPALPAPDRDRECHRGPDHGPEMAKGSGEGTGNGLAREGRACA